MLIRAIREEERALYNSVVKHPLQSWEWGEFRKRTGIKVERIGIFENQKLQNAFQVQYHQLPVIGKTAGYIPRSYMPDDDQMAALKQLATKYNALFTKLEPNIAHKVGTPSAFDSVTDFLNKKGCEPGRSLFTKYTFQLDLKPTEDQLLEKLNSKTRYNVNLAIKRGVTIYENTTLEGMEQYLTLQEETTKRQGFYAHSPTYFRQMWEELGKTGMLRIFHAVYEDKILASWIMFIFNGVLYYPYGASSSENRDVMASNLMMWEMIKYGKKNGCHTFDMWGALGPEPDEKSSWFGFHRFKKGYGGDHMEFLGTFDLVADYPLYKIYRVAEDIRWFLLRLKTKIKK